MARAIWKGAISFGLMYIPIEMHSASRSSTIDLDMLDSRDFAPVGYQRYNKRTGEVVDWNDIVKGYEYKKGQYVALSEEDFRRANVKATQTIAIDSFTQVSEIPPEYYETPYYLVPLKGGEKAYALLREAMRKSGKAAIGTLVMRGRQHVGLIVPSERALLFITIRFADEIRPDDELELPPSAKTTKVAAREVAMAERLVDEMTAQFDPADYQDSYRQDLMKRIREKIRKKQMHVLTPKTKERDDDAESGQVLDLMAVLKKSLEAHGSKRAPRASKAAPKRSGSRARRGA